MYKFKHFQLNNSINIYFLIQLLGVDFEFRVSGRSMEEIHQFFFFSFSEGT